MAAAWQDGTLSLTGRKGGCFVSTLVREASSKYLLLVYHRHRRKAVDCSQRLPILHWPLPVHLLGLADMFRTPDCLQLFKRLV